MTAFRQLRVAIVAMIALVVGAGSAGFVARAADDLDGAGRVVFDVRPHEATIGDPLQATLELTLPADIDFAADPLPDELGPFEVRGGGWSAPSPVQSGRRWNWHGTLVAFETGALTVPAIELKFAAPGDADGGVLRSDPIEIRISTVLDPETDAGPEAELDGLRPPASLLPSYTPLWIAAGLLALALAVVAIVWWLQRRLAARLAVVPVPDDPFGRMPPETWALGRLEALRGRPLDDLPARRVTVDELTAVLKRYLGGRYRVDLLERTTAEVRPALLQAGAPEPAIDESVRLLERCDAFKFAGVDPESLEVRSAIDEAVAIVERTRPRLASVGSDESARGAA